MLLDPGPIPLINTSWYPTTYDTPDFTDLVNSELSGADLIFGSMDALFEPTIVFDDVPTGDTIMADLDTVDQINGSNASLADTAPIANINGFKADGDAALVAAIQVIPGEAWLPVPASTQWGSVAPTAPTASIASVTISNPAGSGKQAFQAGDQFEIVVQMDMTTGQVNDYFQVHIYAEVSKDGVTLPNFEFNDTDHSGSTTRTGVWQATDTGNWSMVVHAVPVTGGNLISSPVTWSVGTQSTTGQGPTGATVKVTLINWTSGNLANNHSGDTWQLFVSGPPNSPVNLWATQNGQALSEVTLGNTDSFGNYTIADKWHDSDIGQWSEHYAVGHFEQSGSISFTILPAGAS